MSDLYSPGDEEPKPNRYQRFVDALPYISLAFFAAILLMMAGDAININQHLIPKAKADQAVSDKYDGDCPTPPAYATVGRCADKCPNPGDYLQGFDKETGAAVCKTQPNPECPYAASVTAGTPLCDKLAAEQQPQTTPVNTTPTTSLTDTYGVAK